MVGVIRRWSYTFFDKLGGTIIKKDMAIPPEYRPVLKMGDFNTPLCFQKKTAALICDFKTAVKTYRSFPVIHLLKQLLELRYGNRKTAFLKSYFSEELPTRELSRGDTIKRLSPLTIFLDTCPPFLIKSSVLANVSLQA